MLIIYWTRSAIKEIERAKQKYNHHLSLQKKNGDKVYFFTNDEDGLRNFYQGLRWGANSGWRIEELNKNITDWISYA